MSVALPLGATDVAIERPRLQLVAWGHAGAAEAERARRVLNIAVAAVMLVVLAPVMAMIALAVKLTSRGPVFYTQKRVGLDRRAPGTGTNHRRTFDHGGRLFDIYKFRTMRIDMDDRQVWASELDQRVTPLGRFLRRYRLDELPQLVNVLRGDMNVVGPRPEQPEIFVALRDRIDQYQKRQRILPGITGLAQINLSYDRCIEDVKKKVEYDLQYLENASLAHDLRILLRTIPVVATKKGAW